MNQAWHSFAIVPAAGESVRMGQPKLLLPWRNSTVIESTLSAWFSGGVSRVIAVTRPDDNRLTDLARAAGADVVVPKSPPPEMKDSIRIALEHLSAVAHPTSADVWLLAPADMPWLSPLVIQQLLSAHVPSHPRILVPVHGVQRGHPVLFPWELSGEVATLAADEGVNTLLKRHGWTPIAVSVDTIHGDLDMPEDYKRLRM